MRPASVISPFSASDDFGDWVHWRKDQPLSSLQYERQTDRRYSNEDTKTDERAELTSMPLPYIMPIQRPQYNALLDRFSNARKHSGTFSTWTTT